MKENKLSREELIKDVDFWRKETCAFRCTGNCDECDEAFEQIKSLLTPIPEDKLDEFVEKWADIVTPVVLIRNGIRPQLMKAMQKDLINMLKEYDELRRSDE